MGMILRCTKAKTRALEATASVIFQACDTYVCVDTYFMWGLVAACVNQFMCQTYHVYKWVNSSPSVIDIFVHTIAHTDMLAAC